MADATQAQKAGSQKMATARYGVYQQLGPFAGKTVDELRTELGHLWKIPSDAQAFKGKEQMDGSYVIQPGDQIEFMKRQGEKG